ncbi:MAG: GNAT family N-acetyltransferase [Thermohalobaculum sp.]|nr:GNAT family N-acetyltransferase [Thermohalobaculum sp.]
MTPIRLAADWPHWEALRRLILDAFAIMEGRIDPPSSAHRLTADSMAGQARTGEVWAIIESEAPIACMFLTPRPDAMYLGKVAVRPDRQGLGLGRQLAALAEARARALGLPALELQSRIEMTEIHAIYARLGFVRTGATAHPGYDRPTSVTMRKELRDTP